MSLTGKTLAGSYKDILQMNNSNSGLTTALRTVVDGEGTASALIISDDAVGVFPQNDDTTEALKVLSRGLATVFKVDTTNQLVTASGNIVNTQYANFGSSNIGNLAFLANTHHPIAFGTATGLSADNTNLCSFGTSTDPATTFTTAEGNATRASDLVPVMWRVPDAMSIDSVTSIEGADTATGDTTRMHLLSYDFTSGSTSALTSGTLLAHNSDVTNAGSEQAYLSSWTVDSAAVTAGKVILAFFRSDSISSDYSIQVTVKYHLT